MHPSAATAHVIPEHDNSDHLHICTLIFSYPRGEYWPEVDDDLGLLIICKYTVCCPRVKQCEMHNLKKPSFMSEP
eukprot:2945335-Karenia_brevis.AAC.1